ncbi:MraY family glycosyltransferase [Pedobacter miscanthi]|uniref:UDP-GlcNAc--UDP-phosphate GlcNAc-1-phosphate transferase n=1 Tax=Pedobacter miscanthi TaxID=2259170 RepID=A0A366KQX1_9SPHI|nr:glycosyltransferase family 4 protein [Pedobacter miscanthi]RBQ03569.1 UDP-GlcNAc--UDP-phosphate GlcNAc-1-phosphate transferase [Pedobacter miscanthi]
MTAIFALITLIGLFIIELVYFRIADRFNIIDKPNHRSSHTMVTIRGGGIVFTLAGLIFFFIFKFQYPYFILGLFLITLISFLDDIFTLNNKVRLSIHLLSVLLMFYQWQLFSLNWYWIPIALIFVIGTINAYNFMDGINGITGGYSLLAITTLYYINEKIILFTSSDLLIVIGLSLLVFNFFNFRRKAKCFAGDVGSVSIAFIIVFLIGQLILKTNNFNYILLLMFYGLDAVTTIIFRVIRKENIFEAHRSHFYQFLSNEKKWPHLVVVTIYILIQLIINSLIVIFIGSNLVSALFLILVSGILFLIIRFQMEGSNRLLKLKNND